MEKAKQMGMEAYKAELNEKVSILELLLKNYDDGRRKGFYCTAVNLLALKDIKTIMEKIDNEIDPDATLKNKAGSVVRLFEEMAAQRDISLKLRKNKK